MKSFHGPDALCAIACQRKRPYNINTMEQHPVPQNVTTFQFRLIGDMTIKQFGYLAGGVLLAYISYRLPLPFFFSWPLALIFGLGGFGFAFVPVEERPMDIWVLSFIKSVYSPTQYVWEKEAPPPVAPPATKVLPTAPAKSPDLHTALPASRGVSDILQGLFGTTRPPQAKTVAAPPHTSVPVPPPPQHTTTPSYAASMVQPKARIVSTNQQTNPWDWIIKYFSSSPAKPAQRIAPMGNYVTPSVTGKHIDLSAPPVVTPAATKTQQAALVEAQNKETVLEKKLTELSHDLENKTMTEARVLELQKQLTEVLAQKEKMQQELTLLRKQAATPPSPAVSPAATHIASPQTPHQPTVKIITPESAVKVGLPRLTTFPNVVTGIIKDSENNLLPGVLVTVKDKDTMPLRALKTNRLGQFAASTPLANGLYFVEIEDPRGRFVFDRVQITLNGSIVPALEIIAKSQRQINRALLEKELFGTKPT